MDGTNGVTECPLPPGATKTYTFLCTQFGTTWYHSHYSDQYSDGAVGTIIINGPATSNYDYDLGTMTLSDWFYRTAFEVQATLAGPGPPGDNVLINGTNVQTNGSGSYHRNTITKGKRYRLRLINTSTDNGYKVRLDGHNFTVITADFVPIEPYSTDWLFLNIGQRYDVIITANQAVDSYWFHAVVQVPCGANKNGNALAIFSYTGANSTTPTRGANNLPPIVSCDDETRIVPYVKLNVPSDQIIPQSSRLDLSLAVVKNSNGQTLVQWNLNATAIDVNWGDPTLQYVLNGNTSYPRSMNVIELPIANTVSARKAGSPDIQSD
jgi:FtsP/CotA-like multicopper oxidase with cupredoxin domain